MVFNYDMKKYVKKLQKLAKADGIKDRSWHMKVTHWDDGDFNIELRSSWGEKIDIYEFRLSTNVYSFKNEIYPNHIVYDSPKIIENKKVLDVK